MHTYMNLIQTLYKTTLVYTVIHTIAITNNNINIPIKTDFKNSLKIRKLM